MRRLGRQKVHLALKSYLPHSGLNKAKKKEGKHVGRKEGRKKGGERGRERGGS